MPKLLMFAPCEKVIIDQDNNPSLISVLQGLTSVLPAKEIKVPEGALAVVKWSIFTLWQRESHDEDTEFTQECTLFTPGGQRTLHASLPFKFTGSMQRNIMQLAGFPISGGPGEYLLKLSLRSGNEEARDIAVYPLTFTLQEPT